MNGIYKSRILDKKMNHVKTKKAKKETKKRLTPSQHKFQDLIDSYANIM